MRKIIRPQSKKLIIWMQVIRQVSVSWLSSGELKMFIGETVYSYRCQLFLLGIGQLTVDYRAHNAYWTAHNVYWRECIVYSVHYSTAESQMRKSRGIITSIWQTAYIVINIKYPLGVSQTESLSRLFRDRNSCRGPRGGPKRSPRTSI